MNILKYSSKKQRKIKLNKIFVHRTAKPIYLVSLSVMLSFSKNVEVKALAYVIFYSEVVM